MDAHEVDVVVIGAGQAGLSAAHALRRHGHQPGSGFVVLDANAAPGGAWQHRWESLRLGTAHKVHSLPGMALEPTPEDLAAPASEVVADYFARYEDAFDLQVRRPVKVSAVHPDEDGRLRITSAAGSWSARALVNATGTWTRPFWPRYPGQTTFRGRQLHTVDYRAAEDFAGQHVVVVGGGASAVQLLAEIAEVATTTWVTRRPPVWREGPFDEQAGREAVARVEAAVRQGRRPGSVVGVTGLAATPAVAAARARGVYDRLPMFDRVTADGVEWNTTAPDRPARQVRADAILWATGFRWALEHLGPLDLREPSGGIRMVGTRTARDPRVHLVGYGPSASTIGANRAGGAAVREIRTLLARDDRERAA